MNTYCLPFPKSWNGKFHIQVCQIALNITHIVILNGTVSIQKTEESMSGVKGKRAKLTLTKEKNCVISTPFLINGTVHI